MFLVKQYTGPGLKLADRIIDRDVYRGPIEQCEANVLVRGTYGSNTGFGNLATRDRRGWVVTSSEVNWEPKGIGTLTINWEVGGPFASNRFLPLDDFREEAVELYPKVEQHPSLKGSDVLTVPGHKIGVLAISLAYAARDWAYRAWSDPAANDQNPLTQLMTLESRKADPPKDTTWAEQKAWGIKLLDWLMEGHETYYLAGLKYCYMRHYFSFPMTTLGGIIQSPSWGPRAGDTTLSWLRLADAVEPVGVNGSAFKLTSAWLGGPLGHWNNNLYQT